MPSRGTGGAANIWKMRKAAKEKGELKAEKKTKKRKNIRARPVTLTTEYAKKKNIRSKPKSKADIAKGNKEKNIKQQTGKKVSKPKHPAHTRKGKPFKGRAGKAYAAQPTPKEKPKKDSREANKEAAGVTGKMPRAKDSQVMKAEKARRARAKADMPTGRSSAASGAYKKKEAAKRKNTFKAK